MSLINVALLGGGIFATEAHLPALFQLQSIARLVGVWSRSEASARKAQRTWEHLGQDAPEIELFFGQDGNQTNSLDTLLARNDIQAVIIALPIANQEAIIRKALQAGKHVLSEKPLAASLQMANKLLLDYAATYRPKQQVWRIAENWEVEPAHLFAAQALKEGRIGDLRSFSISSVLFVDNEGNKYFETEWRKTPEFQGGYLLDAGVHNAGALRTILPEKIVKLSAYTTLNNQHLAPFDWLSAIVQTESSVPGQILIDYGARGRKPCWELRLSGSDGEIYSEDVVQDDVDSIAVEVRSGKFGGANTERKVFPKSGVYEEQRRFFATIAGQQDSFGSVEGALHDVALLEAALTSAGKEVVLATS